MVAFTKMHGLGNDFIVIPHFDIADKEYAVLAATWCDRHTGIGADGLIMCTPAAEGAAGMKIFNSDGSEAMMCGNGLRCLAHYAREKGLVLVDSFAVETRAGMRFPEILSLSGRKAIVRVDMGKPHLSMEDFPVADSREAPAVNLTIPLDDSSLAATCVSMGNPHCVIFTDSIDSIDAPVLGRLIENHRLFPNRINVEFVEIINPHEMKVSVWERGAGLTLACGTGACASLVAAHVTGRSERNAIVRLPGGELEIEWRDDENVIMTGPSEITFEGEIPLPD